MPKKPYLMRGPIGFPVAVSPEDPQGYGDRAIPGTAFVPSGQAESVPHEAAHAELQGIESVIPGAMLLEALISRASEHAYGSGTQYRNPLERYAYGYQEGVAKKPDAQFQESASPEKVAEMPKGDSSLILRNLLDLVGGPAEQAGRSLSKGKPVDRLAALLNELAIMQGQ